MMGLWGSAHSGHKLLLGDHTLEAFEVVGSCLSLARSLFLAPGGGSPLAIDVLSSPSSIHSLLASTASDSLHFNVGQRHALVAHDLAGNTGGRTVHQSLLAVDDIDDDDKLAVVRTVIDEANAAVLDEPCESLSKAVVYSTV